jgi:thymidylate synthase (FAD)
VTPDIIHKIPEANKIFNEASMQAKQNYETLQRILKEHGFEKQANETARSVLPNATTTKFVVTMNCSTLLHFFNLRCCHQAQGEIQKVANKMLHITRKVLPIVFNDAGPQCKKLGYCPEPPNRSCGRYPTKDKFLKK